MADMGHVPAGMDVVAQNDFPVPQKAGRHAHLTKFEVRPMRKLSTGKWRVLFILQCYGIYH